MLYLKEIQLCLSCYHKNIIIFQTLPLTASVSLPHVLLSKERIDFGVSLVGQMKEMTVKLTNFGKSSCCWFVEKGKYFSLTMTRHRSDQEISKLLTVQQKFVLYKGS